MWPAPYSVTLWSLQFFCRPLFVRRLSGCPLTAGPFQPLWRGSAGREKAAAASCWATLSSFCVRRKYRHGGKMENKLLYFLLPPRHVTRSHSPPALSPHISLSNHPQHWSTLLLIPSSFSSLSLCSASLLLWGLHRVGILQWHRVPDGLWRPLSEMDRVSGLCDAVPGPRARRPQLLQEPGPRVQPLVLLPAELRGHRLGLLRLSPG